jgi:hypothetical protein
MIGEEPNFGKFTRAIRERLAAGSEIPLVTKSLGVSFALPRGWE